MDIRVEQVADQGFRNTESRRWLACDLAKACELQDKEFNQSSNTYNPYGRSKNLCVSGWTNQELVSLGGVSQNQLTR